MLNDRDRVLAMLGAMLVFLLNEIHLLRARPHTADASQGYTIAAATNVLNGPTDFYLNTFDMMVRYGLAAMVAALALWAFAGTLQKKPQQQTTR